MKKHKKLIFILMIAILLVACSPEAAPTEEQKLTYCHITPGPDTWYLRVAEGFQHGGSIDGVEIIVVNSDYDVEKELQNIEFCINQGVDGILVFSFNENGAILTAKAGEEAGIPVVAVDSVGSVQAAGQNIVAEVDFDWIEMGELTAVWMADHHPGRNFVHITGNFSSVPMININDALYRKSNELGKNQRVDIREGRFDPQLAQEIAEDLIQSGLDFEIIYVADEDMASAVIRMLRERNLLNNPYIVMSSNGSPVGLDAIKAGELAYTISSSPGWEGYIAYLVLHNYVIGHNTATNQQIYLPIIEIDEDNIDDPMVVVPWIITPDVYEALTQNYFPQLLEFRQ